MKTLLTLCCRSGRSRPMAKCGEGARVAGYANAISPVCIAWFELPLCIATLHTALMPVAAM